MGKNLKNFLNFLKIGAPPDEDVCIMFKRDKAAPAIGRIPYGSGALKSLNHKTPSVRIAGFIVKS